MADLNRLHGEKLIGLPGVRQTRTFFVVKAVVDNAPLAIYGGWVNGPAHRPPAPA